MKKCLKYQRFTPSGGKNKGIRKSEFVTKTQFFCLKVEEITYLFPRQHICNKDRRECYIALASLGNVFPSIFIASLLPPSNEEIHSYFKNLNSLLN